MASEEDYLDQLLRAAQQQMQKTNSPEKDGKDSGKDRSGRDGEKKEPSGEGEKKASEPSRKDPEFFSIVGKKKENVNVSKKADDDFVLPSFRQIAEVVSGVELDEQEKEALRREPVVEEEPEVIEEEPAFEEPTFEEPAVFEEEPVVEEAEVIEEEPSLEGVSVHQQHGNQAGQDHENAGSHAQAEIVRKAVFLPDVGRMNRAHLQRPQIIHQLCMGKGQRKHAASRLPDDPVHHDQQHEVQRRLAGRGAHDVREQCWRWREVSLSQCGAG